MNEYQNYIALSRYSRYQDDKQRRETWEETVHRLVSFWQKKHPKIVTKAVAG